MYFSLYILVGKLAFGGLPCYGMPAKATRHQHGDASYSVASVLTTAMSNASIVHQCVIQTDNDSK